MSKSAYLKTLMLAGATSAMMMGAALAADASVGVPEPDEGAWDVSFGATLTSDYIARGITQTDGGPAIQPWAELSVGWFYLGYWGSNVSPTIGNWEHDLSIGVRPELGPVSLDLGYVNYFYAVGGNAGGELYATAEVSPADPVTIGGGLWYGVGALQNTYYVEANASYELIESLSASAAVGWVGGSAATPYTTWNAGLTWTPAEALEIDVRYHWAPSAVGGSSKVVVSASLSSSLRSLGVIK